MPRLRRHRRVEAARKREQRRRLMSDPRPPPADTLAGSSGTVTPHKVKQWSASALTDHQYNLVVPVDTFFESPVVVAANGSSPPAGPVCSKMVGQGGCVEQLVTDPLACQVSDSDGKSTETVGRSRCSVLSQQGEHKEELAGFGLLEHFTPLNPSNFSGQGLEVIDMFCPSDFEDSHNEENKCSELLTSCFVNGGPMHWRTMECYKVRVIITDQNIQKVSLDGKPETVEELKTKIKEKCKLQYDFNVMYADPDFDNALCNLNDMGDLPATRATVKVVPLMATAATSTSDASDDTEILSTHSSTSSMRKEPLPEFFDIPNPSVGVEFRLRQADLERYEVNYLCGIPEGQIEDSLETERKLLVEEMKKWNPSGGVIASKMDQTFPLRRREIVEALHPVKTLKERWPALFTERQVFAEFSRVVTKNLQVDFFEALDRHTPHFVQSFKTKRGSVGQTLTELVQQIDAGKPDVTAMRTIVLRGLPVLLGDDPSDFYNTCFDCDTDKTWTQVSAGLLTVVCKDVQLSPNQLHLHPVSTAIILEGAIVMNDLQNLPEALCLLFGLSYALRLDYPEAMKNTFDFIQRVMLGLGENKLPSLLSS